MSTATETLPRACTLQVTRPLPDTLCVQVTGNWTIQAVLPPITEIQQQLEGELRVQRLVFDTAGVAEWDSRFLTFLLAIDKLCRQKNVEID
ncbi:MAG: hypothetical protein HY268_27050, partial [Deltaproteobacteria bacterium]|nr:hypothetical protein [Deltaproteobacteria bacterium]